MARPKKHKRVCNLPKYNTFSPGENISDHIITMSIEEFEAVRLIDFENLTQEECAEQMNIARTTVQKLYFDARFKISKSLVQGFTLKIEGGNYKLCNEFNLDKKCCRCRGKF